jgi:methylated-DNA-[protein]-cysteine S-methyltransferase
MTDKFKTYFRSPIGAIEIIGSENGISSVLFVEKVAEEGAEIPACLEDCVSQLDEYFSRGRKGFSLKLDLHGTDFQKRVWHELLKIPFGKTVSYLDIATTIGNRKSTRAVGSANGRNPICIIVPCHRVIGTNGSLINYGGGLWRKEWLLKFENSLTPTQNSHKGSHLQTNFIF